MVTNVYEPNKHREDQHLNITKHDYEIVLNKVCGICF